MVTALVACLVSPSLAQASDDGALIVSSAQITSPPSEEKLALIRQFMKAAGIQSRLDSGSFLERYAFVPELGWHELPSEESREVNLLEILTGPIEALKSAYEKYRPIYQSEYESHINWEFKEDEPRQMIAFFESSVGQHYLEGTWRMEAYTATTLEEIEQSLVTEAVQAYRSR